jgi:transposase
MEHFVGIDVSLDQSSLCVVDATGKIVLEIKVSSEPEPLNACLRRCGLTISRVGLEAGPLSQWLHRGLIGEGFEVVLLETRHVKAALSAMTNKTDRNDARGCEFHAIVGTNSTRWWARIPRDRGRPLI